MTIDVTLTDAGGQVWDFSSDRSVDINGNFQLGFGLEDGQSDTVDNGFVLLVNGTAVNPQAASVDEGGREINTAPVLIDGVAVSRSVLVSDVVSFARVLDSFTNTTDAAVTITVQTVVNSGADDFLQFAATSDGNTVLEPGDTGYVTDDANTTGGDSALLVAYGDGTLVPTSATVNGDDIVVTHTLTLQPGETQSLLQFGQQTDTSVFAAGDLSFFTGNGAFSATPALLQGLTETERASVVNYANVAAPPSATLVDSDGNRWGIDGRGQLSTRDNDALQTFQIAELFQNWDETLSVTTDAETGAVTVVTGGFESLPGSTVTYTYTPLEGQGVVRLVVTLTGGVDGFAIDLSSVVATGAAPALLVSQAFSPDFGTVSGVVLDDSESGTAAAPGPR